MFFSNISRYYGTDPVMDARRENGTAFDDSSKFETVTQITSTFDGKEQVLVQKIASTIQHNEIKSKVNERSVVDDQENGDDHLESRLEDELVVDDQQRRDDSLESRLEDELVVDDQERRDDYLVSTLEDEIQEILDLPSACTVLESTIEISPVNTLLIQISSHDSEESVLDSDGFTTGEETETSIDSSLESFSTSGKSQKEPGQVGFISYLLGRSDDASAPTDNSTGESEYNEIGEVLCCRDEVANERSMVKPMRHYNSRVLADIGTFDFSETDGTESVSDEDCISTI